MVENWREHAACAVGDDASYDLWYDDWDEDAIKRAKAVCLGCPVRAECLSFALSFPASDDAWGVWGGLDPMQRRRLRKAVA